MEGGARSEVDPEALEEAGHVGEGHSVVAHEVHWEKTRAVHEGADRLVAAGTQLFLGLHMNALDLGHRGQGEAEQHEGALGLCADKGWVQDPHGRACAV